MTEPKCLVTFATSIEGRRLASLLIQRSPVTGLRMMLLNSTAISSMPPRKT